MTVTLLDYLTIHGCADIYDEDDYGEGCCWDPAKEIEDDFDRVLEWMERGIVYDVDGKGWDFKSFVVSNLDLFIDFSNLFNGDPYKITGKDAVSLRNGVLTLESLNIGNYCDEHYTWLAQHITGAIA